MKKAKFISATAMLLVLAMFIISKYELSDELIDNINIEIENRNQKTEQ